MQRTATTFALASWLGFLIVSAAIAAAEAWPALGLQGLALQGGPASEPGPAAVGGWAACGVSLFLIAAAGLFVRALVVVHGPDRGGQRRGERLAVCGLALVGATGAVGWLKGLAVFPGFAVGATFWIVLAFSILAVGFDRLVAVHPDEADDREAFEAGIGAIAQGMARQTNLYAGRPQQKGTSRR